MSRSKAGYPVTMFSTAMLIAAGEVVMLRLSKTPSVLLLHESLRQHAWSIP